MPLIIAAFSAFTAYIASYATRLFAYRVGVIDHVQRKSRKIHTHATPLLGGIGIGLAILLGITLSTQMGLLTVQGAFGLRIVGFFIGILILLLGGILDDVYGLPPYVQILFPVAAALAVMMTGTSILEISSLEGSGVWRLDRFQWSTSLLGHLFTLRLPADALTLAWLLGVTYATKTMDGLDGLVTGQTIVGAALILLLASSPAFYQPSVILLTLIVLGAFLGFLPWNVHPARHFLGEAGSTLAGFSLGFLAIVSGAKVATAFMALGIPLVDFVLVVLLRLRSGRSPFQGDDSHLHFRLLRLGFSQRQVAALFWMLALIFGLAAFGLQTRGKTLLMGGLICVTILLSLGAAAKKELSLRWKRRLFFSAVLLTTLVGTWSIIGLWRDHARAAEVIQVTINNRRLWLEIADTPEERTQGLSDRPSMRTNQGMLFLFPDSAPYAFWMPRMRFDLDIIWLQGEQVVDITRLSAPKQTEEPARYTPKASADRVLELIAGQAAAYGIQIGDRLPELQIQRGIVKE